MGGDSGRELWAHCVKFITTLFLSTHLSGSRPGIKSRNGVQYGSWVLWVTLCLSHLGWRVEPSLLAKIMTR